MGCAGYRYFALPFCSLQCPASSPQNWRYPSRAIDGHDELGVEGSRWISDPSCHLAEQRIVAKGWAAEAISDRWWRSLIDGASTPPRAQPALMHRHSISTFDPAGRRCVRLGSSRHCPAPMGAARRASCVSRPRRQRLRFIRCSTPGEPPCLGRLR